MSTTNTSDDLFTIDERLQALEKSVNYLQTQAKNFATLTSVSSAVNYLNTQIATIQQQIKDLAARITSLEQRV